MLKSMFIGALIGMALALSCYGLGLLFYRASYKCLMTNLKTKILAVIFWGVIGALTGLLAALMVAVRTVG